jgi:hypothetical protein
MDATLGSLINDLAYEAACASHDAHGAFVPVEVAWEFIVGVWNDTDDPRRLSIPDERPAQFRHDYERHCRNIQAGNPFYESGPK